jgi:lipopolysaccharide/colanic/teichoic acid biosynthesis glycosyltransferase
MRRGARVLLYLGTAAVVLGLGKYHAAVIGEYDFTGSRRFAWSITYMFLLALAAYGVGLPDVPRTAGQALWSALGATAVAGVGISLLQLVAGSALLPRFVVLWSAVLLVPGYVLCALVAAQGRRRGERRDRVVAIADPDEVAAFATELTHNPERPASLVWALAPADAHPTAPGQQPLVETALDIGASVVVLDRAAQNDDLVVAQVAALHESGIRVRTLSLFYDEWLGKLPVSELERTSLMFDIGEVHRVRYGRIKRLLDLVGALVSLPVLLAATPFVLLGNLVGNRGPLLYLQPRVGKGGEEFDIVKFRTMTPDAGPSEWTTDDDPRITPFGRLLRRTHVDELPQAVNILRGDLSLIGPRPEQPRYVEELKEKIPFYGLRHLVRPGLTGWAQVKYPYGANEIDALEKLQYEFFYLRHQGLGLDARILGRTLRHVLAGGGR